MAVDSKEFKYIIFRSKQVDRKITIVNGIPFYKSSGTASNVNAWLPFYGFYSLDAPFYPGLFIKPGMLGGCSIKSYNIPLPVSDFIKQTISNPKYRIMRLYQILYSVKLGYKSKEHSRAVEKLEQLLRSKYSDFFKTNDFKLKFVKDGACGDNGIVTTEQEVVDWLKQHKLKVEARDKNPLAFKPESSGEEMQSELEQAKISGPRAKSGPTELGKKRKRPG